MTHGKKFLSIALCLALVLSLIEGVKLTASAIAYNEVAGPRTAGELTSFIYGDFVTEGDSPIGYVNPWSAFDWLTDGETIIAAYCGPYIATAGTDFEGMGEYGYLGSARMPDDTSAGSLMMVLLGEADQDIRIYFFNEKSYDVNVSFHIQSTSNAGFGAHSVASVTTPDGTTVLDHADVEDPDQNLSADFSFTLAPYTGTAPEYYYGDYGDQESMRPTDPEEGKSPVGCFYISLTTQPQLGNDPSAGVIISNFFAGGDSDTLAEITLQAPAYGSYTATAEVPNTEGEGTVTVTETVSAGGADKSFSYLPANGFTLSATGDSNYAFDYWSKTGNALSYDAVFNTRAYGNGDTVVANFLPEAQTRAFDVNGTRYVSWTEAVQAAQSANATIILKRDYTFATTLEELAAKGDTLETGILENNDGIHYILPAGVKFLIPYNDQDTGSFADGPGFSIATPGGAYKTLTIPANVTFSVLGKLNVNACAYANNSTSFMGGAAGDYGYINLAGALNVENGGELRTFGYIAGAGRVDIKSGGSSYEVLQMTDWGGGSYAMSWKNHVDDNTLRESSFYFSQYYVQNVESDYRVYAGAAANVYGHLAATMSGVMLQANVSCGFIGDAENTLFTMANGYIERRYNGTTDRITYDVHGDMTAKAITVDVMSIATVASQEWLLGLTNNMDVIASEGTTTLQYGYMVLPDTRVVVNEGAEVVIAPSARVHIWRLDDWQDGFVGRPSNQNKKLVPIRYTVANGTTVVRTALTNSGVLVNNGTVTAYSNVFTTDNGGTADDMVIQGTGTLINYANPNGTPSGVLNQLKKSNEWVTINTQPVLSYMYGESELESFGTGTFYSQPTTVDTHGNGTYDSWYQWQVDYTLTDENGNTISYTDYTAGSDIDLDGTLIVDGKRYVITSMDSIKDSSDNNLSTITWDGNVVKNGVALNKNAAIADGWEFIQFHNLNQNIKVALHVQSYDYRVIWTEPAADKTEAVYITGNTASYEWDQDCAVNATVTPADGATATVLYGATTVLNLTNITTDVTVSAVANADSWPVTVNVTYPDSTPSSTVTIFSTQDENEIWTTNYAPEKPAEGWYVIGNVSITGSNVVSYQNHNDSLTVTGVNTSGVVVNVTLEHKDYKITYNTTGANVAIAPSYVNENAPVIINNTDVGTNYVFGEATIATSGTEAVITVEPTRLILNDIDGDLTVNVPLIYYDYIVTADGQTKYVEDGGEVTFTLDAGYALNGASIPSNQVGTVAYTNPETPEGTATITVSGIGSDVDVAVDKVHFDAIVTFKDSANNVLATKYYGTGSTITYTAVDEGVGGSRFYVAGITPTGATASFTEQMVSVTAVSGTAAEVVVNLVPFTYKVTWNDGVETTYTFLTGAENEATYTPVDGGVGSGSRYIIQTGYGEHANGATNSYPSTNGKSQFTVANINADETVTLTLNTYTYKVVFTDQNDNVLKTQYADAEDHDVTISVGDNTIRYDVAGLDFSSEKNTIIVNATITGTATANNGAAFGEGVSRVTLTGIGSDVTAKLEVYEYDHKIIVVVNDINGWSSETETHYVEGDNYSWTKPVDAEYDIDSFLARAGSASRSGDTVTMDLTGIADVEAELDIVTIQTVERLKITNITNGTKNTATINITDSAYGVFTVTCARACVIAIDNGDGTYTRLTAVPTGETNEYEFSCPANFADDIALIVAVKGDATGDGQVQMNDSTRAKAAYLGKVTLTGAQLLATDINGDGVVAMNEATQIKATYLGKRTFQW